MKKVRDIFFSILLAAIVSAISITSTAKGEESGAIQVLYALTHYVDRPTRVSNIWMRWEPVEVDGIACRYYVLFDNDPDYIIDEEFAAIYTPGDATQIVSLDYAEYSPDDVAYYFHIATDCDGKLGPTETAGPFRIDVVPPSGVSVTVPEVTSARTVQLTLKAEGASEVFISNIKYEGEDSRWEEMTVSPQEKEWELSEGGGDKTIYVRFRDIAGNKADASTVAKLIIPGDIDGNGATDLRDGILALKISVGAGTDGIRVYSEAAVGGNKKIGTEDAGYILRQIR